MQFPSCSKADKIFAPIKLSSNATKQPKIELIYNGNTFDYNPHPVVSKEDKTD